MVRVNFIVVPVIQKSLTPWVVMQSWSLDMQVRFTDVRSFLMVISSSLLSLKVDTTLGANSRNMSK